MKHRLITLITSLTLLLSPYATAGDFHYQIDVIAKVLGAPDNQIGALQMSWLYDAETTALLTQDLDLSSKNRQQSLDELGKRTIKDLKRLNYFTEVTVNGKSIQLSDAENLMVELIQEKYLRLFFILPFSKTVPSTESTLRFSLVDPHTIALLLIDSQERVSLDDALKANCNITLVNFKEYEHGTASQQVDVKCQ